MIITITLLLPLVLKYIFILTVDVITHVIRGQPKVKDAIDFWKHR